MASNVQLSGKHSLLAKLDQRLEAVSKAQSEAGGVQAKMQQAYARSLGGMCREIKAQPAPSVSQGEILAQIAGIQNKYNTTYYADYTDTDKLKQALRDVHETLEDLKAQVNTPAAVASPDDGGDGSEPRSEFRAGSRHSNESTGSNDSGRGSVAAEGGGSARFSPANPDAPVKKKEGMIARFQRQATKVVKKAVGIDQEKESLLSSIHKEVKALVGIMDGGRVSEAELKQVVDRLHRAQVLLGERNAELVGRQSGTTNTVFIQREISAIKHLITRFDGITYEACSPTQAGILQQMRAVLKTVNTLEERLFGKGVDVGPVSSTPSATNRISQQQLAQHINLQLDQFEKNFLDLHTDLVSASFTQQDVNMSDWNQHQQFLVHAMDIFSKNSSPDQLQTLTNQELEGIRQKITNCNAIIRNMSNALKGSQFDDARKVDGKNNLFEMLDLHSMKFGTYIASVSIQIDEILEGRDGQEVDAAPLQLTAEDEVSMAARARVNAEAQADIERRTKAIAEAERIITEACAGDPRNEDTPEAWGHNCNKALEQLKTISQQRTIGHDYMLDLNTILAELGFPHGTLNADNFLTDAEIAKQKQDALQAQRRAAKAQELRTAQAAFTDAKDRLQKMHEAHVAATTAGETTLADASAAYDQVSQAIEANKTDIANKKLSIDDYKEIKRKAERKIKKQKITITIGEDGARRIRTNDPELSVIKINYDSAVLAQEEAIQMKVENNWYGKSNAVEVQARIRAAELKLIEPERIYKENFDPIIECIENCEGVIRSADAEMETLTTEIRRLELQNAMKEQELEGLKRKQTKAQSALDELNAKNNQEFAAARDEMTRARDHLEQLQEDEEKAG